MEITTNLFPLSIGKYRHWWVVIAILSRDGFTINKIYSVCVCIFPLFSFNQMLDFQRVKPGVLISKPEAQCGCFGAYKGVQAGNHRRAGYFLNGKTNDTNIIRDITLNKG